ncbi:MAG TPA: MmgE/PrpD family protein [Candidatus Limnocylindria bacterium]|nr:MmgE/PrpD family protein [Candidatus Limnocylindria bacterium]
MALTRSVAEFIVNTPPSAAPDHVRHLATRSIFDGIGLALAGSVAETAHLVARYLEGLGCGGEATIIGSTRTVPPRFAAFANGIAIHADDYDDTQLAVQPDRVYGLLTHPTAPVLPAVLADAEVRGASGAAVLDAYLIGTEVEMKVSEAIASRHYQDGFHSTGTIGAIGAAAALARLRRADVTTTARMLGIAASQSAGLRENFGTMTKPFHAGRAAENGVLAADLALLGWTAAEDILEARRGFFQAAGGGYDAASIDGTLGRPWSFERPGVSIKPHPSGSLTHPGMLVMKDLIERHDIRPEQVARVRVGTNRNTPNALIHHRPRTELNAKFSMEFCMAILLLERRAGLAEFTDEVVQRPDVQALIERVEFGVHPEAEAAGYEKMTTIVDVELTDGRVLSGQADFGKGSPTNPITDAELEAKFLDCAAWARYPRREAEAVAKSLWGLAELSDIRDLLRRLRRDAAPA